MSFRLSAKARREVSCCLTSSLLPHAAPPPVYYTSRWNCNDYINVIYAAVARRNTPTPTVVSLYIVVFSYILFVTFFTSSSSHGYKLETAYAPNRPTSVTGLGRIMRSAERQSPYACRKARAQRLETVQRVRADKTQRNCPPAVRVERSRICHLEGRGCGLTRNRSVSGPMHSPSS
jgi:hypothetical protein